MVRHDSGWRKKCESSNRSHQSFFKETFPNALASLPEALLIGGMGKQLKQQKTTMIPVALLRSSVMNGLQTRVAIIFIANVIFREDAAKQVKWSLKQR